MLDYIAVGQQEGATIALGGKPATEIWAGEKHFSVVERLASTDRTLGGLDRILIDTPDGARIPASDVDGLPRHVRRCSGSGDPAGCLLL